MTAEELTKWGGASFALLALFAGGIWGAATYQAELCEDRRTALIQELTTLCTADLERSATLCQQFLKDQADRAVSREDKQRSAIIELFEPLMGVAVERLEKDHK